MDEVGNPTILATFAVIAAILPMAFVHGLMGPYMRPIPVGASSAMLFSLMVAFVVSPWASLRLLRHTPTRAATPRQRRLDDAALPAIMDPPMVRRHGGVFVPAAAYCFIPGGGCRAGTASSWSR